MIPLPPEPAAGYPLLAWAQRVQRTLAQLRPVSGPGILITETTGGHVIESTAKSGSASTADPLPWDVSLTGVGAPDPVTGKYASFKGKVWPGMVQGFVPANIGGTTGLAEFAVAAAWTYWICTIATDGKTVTGATISTSTSLPAAQTPTNGAMPGTAAFVFAVSWEGRAWRTLGAVNPSLSSYLVLEIANAGQDPERWYVWRIE
jgi:hypothetical protein